MAGQVAAVAAVAHHPRRAIASPARWQRMRRVSRPSLAGPYRVETRPHDDRGLSAGAVSDTLSPTDITVRTVRATDHRKSNSTLNGDERGFHNTSVSHIFSSDWAVQDGVVGWRIKHEVVSFGRLHGTERCGAATRIRQRQSAH